MYIITNGKNLDIFSRSEKGKKKLLSILNDGVILEILIGCRKYCIAK